MLVSVIIPTRNEEDSIGPAIAGIRRNSRRSGLEIIVADGRSSDRTMEIARAAADKVISVEQAGRALQMQAGARAASGDLLLFLHADTSLPADWEEALAQAWQVPGEKPAATAFTLGFDRQEPFYRLLAWAAKIRTSMTGVPLGDQAIAVDRRVFLREGGFPPVPLMEEYLLCRRLKPLGRIVILPGRVRTSARRYESGGRLPTALRNAAITVLYYLGVPPRALARLYR